MTGVVIAASNEVAENLRVGHFNPREKAVDDGGEGTSVLGG